VLVKIIIIMKNISNILAVSSISHLFFFIFTIFFFVNQSYSQTKNIGRKVTISYKNNNYGIIGRVHKKQLVEGRNFILFEKNHAYSKSLIKDTILDGVYHISENGSSLIKGTWKKGDDYYYEGTLIKGTFIVSNNHNGKGININKNQSNSFNIKIKEISYLRTFHKGNNETITLDKQMYSNYNLTKQSNYYTYKTSIQFDTKQYQNLISSYNELFLHSKNVVIKYYNGDEFEGSVKYGDYNKNYLTPKSGTYKYKTGEISIGDFHYQPDFGQIIIIKGKTRFSDGSIGMNKWMDKFGLDYEQKYKIRGAGSTLTEMRNMAKSIWEEKERKLLEKENEKREIKERKKTENLQKLNILKNKYGNYWGVLVHNMEFTLGMSIEMISEFAPKKYFKISKLLRNKNHIEIWKFDRQKMNREIVKVSGEDARKTLFTISLAESMGLGNIESETPELVFTNRKLTEIIYN